MFAFLLVAQAFGIINEYLKEEASEEDFWDAPAMAPQVLNEEEKQQKWFMINPEKLKEKYRVSYEALMEASLILIIFVGLREFFWYSFCNKQRMETWRCKQKFALSLSITMLELVKYWKRLFCEMINFQKQRP